MGNICVELKHQEMQGMQSIPTGKTMCSKLASSPVNAAVMPATSAFHDLHTAIAKHRKPEINYLILKNISADKKNRNRPSSGRHSTSERQLNSRELFCGFVATLHGWRLRSASNQRVSAGFRAKKSAVCDT
jgi:hypothetical protein